MLTRIYGTAFFTQKDLEAHLERLEQARARTTIASSARSSACSGCAPRRPGMPFWLPKGTVLLRLIEDEVREQLRRRGYDEIKTPQIMDAELWHRSGHWDNYRENMFFAEPSERDRDESDRGYAVRPMNCPGACLAFGSERHSYRDLPLRLAEFGLSRATSARACCTACCACAPSPRTTPTSTARSSRSPAEVNAICDAIDQLYASFGFDDVRVELSTKPEKSIGTDEQWEQATEALRRGAGAPGPRVRAQPGRRRLLRPQDRLPRDRRDRPLVAARHLPARLLHARALRAHLPGRGQRRAPPGDDPPRPAGLDGALRRDPDRAPRRPLPDLARARAGDGPAGRRPPQRVRGRSRRRAARGGRARARSTSAPSRSGRRSATPSWPRCRTCSSSATRSRRPARRRGALARGGRRSAPLATSRELQLAADQSATRGREVPSTGRRIAEPSRRVRLYCAAMQGSHIPSRRLSARCLAAFPSSPSTAG